jgi:hypothetical protein
MNERTTFSDTLVRSTQFHRERRSNLARFAILKRTFACAARRCAFFRFISDSHVLGWGWTLAGSEQGSDDHDVLSSLPDGWRAILVAAQVVPERTRA